VELVPVELGQFVAGTARVWQARCAAHGVLFRLDTPAAPVWTTTDAGRLRQVLDGLFDNALRVTPAGAPIVLAARADPGAAVVEVRDGGPGLRPEDLPVAFEQGVLYERYRGIRQVGTGLGLAIVHGLVQRLGATIEAGAASEGGARFTVCLPPAAATS
jgi:two-component system sensor histidine kinase BaeS